MLNLKSFWGINPKNNFSNFIEGKSNKMAKTAALHISDNFGNTYNPLFLYGNTGLGKTHLLHAVCNGIIRKNKVKIIYMNSEDFTQDMIKSLKNNSINKFKQYYRSLNVLIIDDIQFFANKPRSQEELIYTFHSLLDRNQQLVLSSNQNPKRIIGIQDKLKSLIELGLVVKIETPELKTRISILSKQAIDKNINLSNDIIYFIAFHLNSNVRELQGALNYIIAYAKFLGKKININLVKKILPNILKLKKYNSIRNIQKIVSEHYKINIKQLISKFRLHSIVRPRQIAMYLSKKLTNNSLTEIGKAFGGRDHTTVLHACKKIKKLYKNDLGLREDYNIILNRLN